MIEKIGFLLVCVSTWIIFNYFIFKMLQACDLFGGEFIFMVITLNLLVIGSVLWAMGGYYGD